MAASPAALFEQVNDHHKFTVWNPFLKLDPNVNNTEIGAGSANIIERKLGELVRERMDWKRPMAA